MKFQPGTQFKIDNVAQLKAAYEAYEEHFCSYLKNELSDFNNNGYRILIWFWFKEDSEIGIFGIEEPDYTTIPNPFKHIRG